MATDFATIQAKGREVLMKRAAFREAVRGGYANLSMTLEEPDLPEWLNNAKLAQTLRAQPGVGEATARDICASFSYPADFKLGKIPHSRRVELAEALRERS